MKPQGKRGIFSLLQLQLEFRTNFLILLFLGQPPPPFSFPFLRTNCIAACSLLALPEGSPPACLGPPTDSWLCLDRRTQVHRREHLACFHKGGESPWWKQSDLSNPYWLPPWLPNMARVWVAFTEGCPGSRWWTSAWLARASLHREVYQKYRLPRPILRHSDSVGPGVATETLHIFRLPS